MELSTKHILPGSFVVVKDTNSIFEGGNWDKLITFQLTNLEIV